MENSTQRAKLLIDEKAFEKMQKLVFGNPMLECGGFLIGNVSKDAITNKWTGVVDDIFCIQRYGEEASFTFSSADTVDALNYVAKEYRTEWQDSKHIIGNFHSHGQIDAHFSSTDEEMMKKYISNEFYLVYSAGHKVVIAKFKNEQFEFCDADITIIKSKKLALGHCENTQVQKAETFYSPAHINITQATFEKEVKYSQEVQSELDKRFNYSAQDLSGKRVLIVGAGTIGNEIVKNLAFSGVSDFTIVDMDIYKYHNLPRSPLVTVEDVGVNKAFALAKRIVEKSPFSIKATGINADISVLGWGFLKQFDLIISPVDSFAIRKYIDRGCRLYNKTHITAGTGVQYIMNNRMLGDIIVSPANSNVCYMCTEVGSMKAMESRTGCSEQPAETQPQVMGFSSTIAGIASSASLSCLLNKFHEYADGACKDENFNPLYWKMSASEVGLCPQDISSGVSNLVSNAYVRQKKNCEHHTIMEGADNKIYEVVVSGVRSKQAVWKQISEVFSVDDDAFSINLTDWSLVYFLAYKKPAMDSIRIVQGSDYHDDLDMLPKEHIYKVTLDSDFDAYKLIKIIFEG